MDVHDYLDVLVAVDMFERNRVSVFPYVVQAADRLVEILLCRVAVIVLEVQFVNWYGSSGFGDRVKLERISSCGNRNCGIFSCS